MKTKSDLPKHQLRLLAEVALYKLYESHLDDNQKEKMSLFEVRNTFSVPVSRKLLQSAIDHLRSNYGDKLINRTGTAERYFYQISTAGIIFVEDCLKNSGSLISYFAENGDESLEDVAGFKSIYHIDGEHQAPDWIELKVDVEKKEYKALTKSLEASIEEIRKSNELGSQYPDEKEVILACLEEGKQNIASGRFIKSRVLSLISSPLKWIATTFAKTALQVAATDTIQKLFELLSVLHL